MIAWDRVAANIAWWRLVRKELRFQTIDIVGPRLALDRLATGDLNLVALLPEAPPPPADGATAPQPATPDAGWRVAVDRLRLDGGSLRFRDLMVAGAEPVEIVLPEISVAQVAVQAGSYTEPGRLRLALGVDRGRLRIDAALAMREDGPVLDARLRAVRLPLRRTRVYVPSVGLTDLSGETGAALRLRYDADRGPRLGGTVLVDGLRLTAEGLPEPALAWRRLLVRIARLAVDERRVALRELRLDGPTFLLRPAQPEPVPLLAVLRASEPAVAPAEPAEAPAEAAEAAAGPPWGWAIDRLAIDDLRLVLLGENSRLEATGRIEAGDLRGPEPATVPLLVDLGLGGGTARVEGEAAVDPPAFAGTVSVAALSLPEPLAVTAAVPPGAVRNGTLGLGLTVDAAPSAGSVRVRGDVTLDAVDGAWPTPAETRLTATRIALAELDVALPAGGAGAPLTARGKLTVDRLAVTSAVPGPLALAVERLVLAASDAVVPLGEAADPLRVAVDLTLDALSLRGAEGDESAVAARRLELRGASAQLPGRAGPGPMQVKIDSIRLEAPSVTAVRTEAGLRLPGLEPSPATAESSPAAAPAPGEPAAAARTAESPAPPPEILVGSLRLGDGQLLLVDRAVKPFYRGGLRGLRIEMDRFRLPQPAIDRLRLEATAPGGGRRRAAAGERRARDA